MNNSNNLHNSKNLEETYKYEKYDLAYKKRNVMNQIFKDYKEKIYSKIALKTENTHSHCNDLNSMIVFFNYCFQNKNSFFIDDFNLRLIFHVNESYNKLKSNILSEEPIHDISELFANIRPEDLKTIKFILFRYTKLYDEIFKENRELCEIFDKTSAKNCIGFINSFMGKLDF